MSERYQNIHKVAPQQGVYTVPASNVSDLILEYSKLHPYGFARKLALGEQLPKTYKRKSFFKRIVNVLFFGDAWNERTT